MLKLTKTGIGLLTRQYRSVLKKCLLINLGVFTLGGILTVTNVRAETWGNLTLTGDQGWGTITTGNGYSNISDWYIGNADIVIGRSFNTPSSELSMQIDGYFYQNEGNYRVLDTSDIISSVTNGSGKVVTSGAVYSALSGYATKTTTLSGYGITNAYTKTEVDNLISQAGGSSVDLSNYYTKSETYSINEINNIQSLNNYYRKDEKSGILNGFEAGKIGNENDDNFSKFRAVNGDFASKNGDFVLNNDSFLTNNDNFVAKNPSRFGAFAKCEKACPRPSERFPVSMEKNSAFAKYSRSARGTFLFVSQTHKNVLDNFYKNSQCLKASNDNFATTTFLRAI